MLFSDDIEALEAKENEVALEILAKKKADESASTKRKRGGRKPPTSEATEDAIAKALGKRPPVPQPLVNVDAKSKKAKKTAKDLLKGGHDDLDASILNVKKNLLSKLSTGKCVGLICDCPPDIDELILSHALFTYFQHLHLYLLRARMMKMTLRVLMMIQLMEMMKVRILKRKEKQAVKPMNCQRLIHPRLCGVTIVNHVKCCLSLVSLFTFSFMLKSNEQLKHTIMDCI